MYSAFLFTDGALHALIHSALTWSVALYLHSIPIYCWSWACIDSRQRLAKAWHCNTLHSCSLMEPCMHWFIARLAKVWHHIYTAFLYIDGDRHTLIQHITYLKRGTTFQMTEKSDSGEMALLLPCHRSTSVLRSSSTTNLKAQLNRITHTQEAMIYFFTWASCKTMSYPIISECQDRSRQASISLSH